MKIFYKSCPIVCVALFVFATCLFSGAYVQAATQYYYQLKIYHFKNKAQESRLDAYLQNAYLPALHKAGVKDVGVFKPITQDSLDRKIYVYVPYRTWNDLENTDTKLLKDANYLAAGKDYLDAAHNDPTYTRLETIILRAFVDAPVPTKPNLTAPKADRVYELRSYESASEKYNISKVKMFNAGDEIGIFKALDFNAVFYAEVIAGTRMPNLMYMITFNSKQDNAEKWKAFRADAKFAALGKMEEYKNNVSKIDATFLHPTEYSDY